MIATFKRPVQATDFRVFARGETLKSSSPSNDRYLKNGKAAIQNQRTSIKTEPQTVVEGMMRCGEKHYCRNRDLPGLLHIFPAELARLQQTSPHAIIQKITLALCAERRRGRSGHYRYSLLRHIGLMQALAAERLNAEAKPTTPKPRQASREDV